MSKIKIFISWSKDTSKALAQTTKDFLEDVFHGHIDFPISTGLPFAVNMDEKIHEDMMESQKCIVCITLENYKAPWLMYESGVIYGKNYGKDKANMIVYPLLFDDIPDYTSYVDKPLNRFNPLKLYKGNMKETFEKLVKELCEEQNINLKIALNILNSEWKAYSESIENRSIPSECKNLVNQLQSREEFSPKIQKGEMHFLCGYNTDPFYRVLTEIAQDDTAGSENKRKLWIYGRKNTLLLGDSYSEFFDKVKENDIDFRCLFVKPHSPAAAVAERDRQNLYNELKTTLHKAWKLSEEGLKPEKLFKLYSKEREKIIIRSDDSIIYVEEKKERNFPRRLSDCEFYVISIHSEKGKKYNEIFLKAWEEAEPLTKDVEKEADLKIPKDFIVFISGVPGIGKTTISYGLLKEFDDFRIIEETDLIREVLRGYNEYINDEFKSIMLDKIEIADHTKILTFDEAKQQCRHMKKPLEKIIERQQRKEIPTIINGVHIIPEVLCGFAGNKNIIYINLYVNNQDEISKRISGRKKDKGSRSSYMLEHIPLIYQTNDALSSSTSELAQSNDNVFNIDITNLEEKEAVSEIMNTIQKFCR